MPNYRLRIGESTNIPAWRSNMEANTWIVVPLSNSLSDVDPAADPTLNPNAVGAAPWRGTGGQSMVVDAWNSFVPSQTDGRLWLTCCGGHGDYAGNEHYELNLLLENPYWVMKRRPSSNSIDGIITLNDGQESTGVYSDGRIRSTHVYQTQVHVPGRGIFMSDNTASYSSAAGNPQKAFWITEAGEHSVACDYSALPLSAGAGGCCYDSTRDVLWFTRANSLSRIAKYNPNSGEVTAHGTTDSWVGSNARMIYIASRDLVAHLTGIGSGLVLWNPATETWKRSVTVNGTKPTWLSGNTGACGSAWVESLGKIVLWNNTTDAEKLATLTPGADAFNDAWTWGELAASPSNAVTPPVKPSTPSGIASILGKFGYVPFLNGCYLQTQYSSDLYFYSLGEP